MSVSRKVCHVEVTTRNTIDCFTLLLFFYRSLKSSSSSCEKQFNDRVELRSHNKIHETSTWNAASGTLNANADNSALSSEMHQSRVVNNSHSPTNDIVMEPDSTVSERVLLDTVAEREVMDQVEVSWLVVFVNCVITQVRKITRD